MRTKKPRPASMDEVKISRDGPSAVLQYADDTIGTVHLTIGPEIAEMSEFATGRADPPGMKLGRVGGGR